MSQALFSALVLSHLILTTLQSRYSYSHFTYEDSETEIKSMPKFTQLVNGRTRFQAMQYNARALSFNHYPKAQKIDNSRLFPHMLKKKKKEKEK